MNLLLIGDSYGVGMRPYVAQAFSHQFSRGYVTVSAETGWSTRRWMREGDVSGLLHQSNPNIVIVALGTNDEGEENSPDAYESMISRFDAMAAETGALVIWVTSFAGPGSEERFRLVRETVGFRRVIDGRGLVSGLLSGDSVHPSGRNYQIVAEKLASEVRIRWLLSLAAPIPGAVVAFGLGAAVVAALLRWW